MKTQELPKSGFAGLKAHFKDDFIAGFSVSLIALPLCLGIAIASGFPPLAGIITAIVGGLFASRIAGTFVTISGPAAGLIVISLGAATTMGGAGVENGFAGYEHALGAIVIAGLIMVAFGLLKVGKVGDFFPTAAVHGMLAAIGCIIIIKQFFPAIGVPSPKGEILEVASEIPNVIGSASIYALTISLVALAILIIHPMLKIKMIKMIPAPMWVLIATIPLAAAIGTQNLNMVKMPHNLFGSEGFKLPSFEKIATSAFWIAVTGFALVSAIETMLSAKAVDSLDPYKRTSNLDKDMISMGAGSSLAAAIGGLPMISEIVRSSANVNNGAKTTWSNFFHGLFLLVYLLIGVAVIEMIPIAALAAMLVFTGFRLASPKEFKHMFKIGLIELEIFLVTLFAVLATDLILGILIGILFKYVLIIFKGAKLNELFKSKGEQVAHENDVTLKLSGAQIFSNYLSLKKKMNLALKEKNTIILDFKNVTFIDHTVMEHLEDYARQQKQKSKDVYMLNLDTLNPVSSHPLSARDKNLKNVVKDIKIPVRTINLLNFAQIHQYKYSTKTNLVNAWQFYNVSIRKQILSIENLIEFNENSTRYIFADITTLTGSGITEEIETVSGIKIKLNRELPKFYLFPAQLIDKIKTNLGDDSVQFTENPIFNSKYIVKSDKMEVETKAFLNPEVLDYLCSVEVFIASNGVEVFISQKSKVHEVHQIESLINYAKKFTNLLHK